MEGLNLTEKLAGFDAYANEAVDMLIDWIEKDREALVAAAKGRLVEGHYRYRDTVMYEYDVDALKAEACQEIADAINYLALREARLPRHAYPPAAA